MFRYSRQQIVVSYCEQIRPVYAWVSVRVKETQANLLFNLKRTLAPLNFQRYE